MEKHIKIVLIDSYSMKHNYSCSYNLITGLKWGANTKGKDDEKLGPGWCRTLDGTNCSGTGGASCTANLTCEG